MKRSAAIRVWSTCEAPSGALPRDIQWIAEGVAFAGSDLRQMTAPLVAMERVPGRTLIQTVDRLCREGQVEPLALLADVWLATATALEEAAFVHGDLAPDNLIVRPDGSIALVDLDTAMWPSFVEHPGPSGEQPRVCPPAWRSAGPCQAGPVSCPDPLGVTAHPGPACPACGSAGAIDPTRTARPSSGPGMI